MASNESLNILHLPEEIIETMLSYLTYHETSEVRGVCTLFNKFCQQRLNKGFNRVDKFHSQIQKEVKNKLPRRESERRNHQLARHVDILSAIETRLSLLGMSYTKYMDSGLCCFIPGKVLDELMTILLKLQSSDQPPRSHEFLQELRDISSMAMEHFDEKIAPGLKSKLPPVTLPYPFSDACTSMSSLLPFPSTPVRGPSIRTEVNHLRMQVTAQGTHMQQVKKDVNEVKTSYCTCKKKMLEQSKKIFQQGRTIGELEKKVNDLNQKFVDMSAELQKLREAQEGGDNAGTLTLIRKDEFNSSSKNQLDNEKACTSSSQVYPRKELKRKQATSTESRVKRSKN